MEIIGIGIDLVENARIAQSLERFGDAFLQRVFLPEELAYCRRMRYPVPHYAARFAAKEALSKAFGCGIGAEMGMLDIEVTRGETGAPSLRLHGIALETAHSRRLGRIFLTLSHTDNYAIAQVLLTAAATHE